MMIDPISYIDEIKDKSLDELMRIRKRLSKDINRLENIVCDEKKKDEAWSIDPGPDVQYQTYLENMSKLCLLISERYNKEFVLGIKNVDIPHIVIKHDPVEDSEEYKNAEPYIEEMLIPYREQFSKEQDEWYEQTGIRFGSCHRIWSVKKKLLKEEFGIDWKTPREMNPGTNFD